MRHRDGIRRKDSELAYSAVGARHVRVEQDGRLILFANRSKRDWWLIAQTGRVAKAQKGAVKV